MSAISRTSVLCVLAVALVSSAASAECRWGRFHFMFGSDVPAMATADSGKPCWLSIKTGKTSEFTGFTVSKQPAHGRVTMGKNVWDAWIYTSDRDYHGADSFIGTITGHDVNFSGTTNVAVSIAVQ